MYYIVDAHQDLAYNMLNFNRDYLRSVLDIRRSEKGQPFAKYAGESVLGWPEFQRGHVAVVFSTLFVSPDAYKFSDIDKVTYKTAVEARPQLQKQVDIYHAWEQNHPDKFQIIRNASDVDRLIKPWLEDEPEAAAPRPVGLVMLMEGAEAIGEISDLDYWWQQGVRVVGPVWAGTRFCGGTHTRVGFSSEGYELLDFMHERGFILDVSHMNEQSSLQALNYYEGPILASHVNARAVTGDDPHERQFSDASLKALLERDGVIGAVLYNRFIKGGWSSRDGKHAVTLYDLVAHIDHVCQLAGDTRHAAIGSDFDGGFGLNDIPAELDTIADLQLLAPILMQKGYNETDVQNILGANWINTLRNGLPR